MLLGVQSKNVVNEENPEAGFRRLREAGFQCMDYSLNSHLLNTDLYKGERNGFFDKSMEELKTYFAPMKRAAEEHGITINQMHMPYPNYVPGARQELNDWLRDIVAGKSMEICAYLHCPHIVIHGLKLRNELGGEELEWEETERFLEAHAVFAKEHGITMCIENIYTSQGGHIVEGPCCDARKAVKRIDRMNERYGAEVLGFCFDTGHANLVGLDFEDFLLTLGKRLKVLHIHDNDGVRDLHQIPFVFTRTRENKPITDWEGFVRGLRKIGFDGVLSFETAPVLHSFPEEMRWDALSFIAKCGEYFKKRIEGN